MSNKKEIWKPVVNYEKFYMVSNFGNVKCLVRYIKNGKFSHFKKEKNIKPGTNSDGYKTVVLYGESEKRSFKVHRLVAECFIKNINNLEMVNHIDSDKSNNHVANLEWVSRRENGVHRYLNKKTSSKYCGVSWSKKNKKWMATIRFNNKQIYLGCFINEIDAYNRRKEFEIENGIINKYL